MLDSNLSVLIPSLIETAHKEGIQRFVVAGIIKRNEKILCLKRAGHDFMPGIYELPSGKVETEETLPAALKREIQEETALALTNISKYISHFDYTSKSGVKTRQFNFLTECQGKVQLDENEHEGYTWLNADEIDRYNITQETKKVIQSQFSTVAFRSAIEQKEEISISNTSTKIDNKQNTDKEKEGASYTEIQQQTFFNSSSKDKNENENEKKRNIDQVDNPENSQNKKIKFTHSSSDDE